MSLIDIKNTSFAYGKNIVFSDINFSVNKGQVICLLGPNGCGKTTLLDCILGIHKINQGEISVNGKAIDKLKTHQIAKYISYVPQLHEKTFPYKVIDIVLMGRAVYTSIFSSPKEEDIYIAKRSLEQVGMLKYCDKPYTKLSGGEGQLVMIARALAQETPIMIMDEPTSHLDLEHEMRILSTIKGLVKNKNLSIIMATHFPNHAYYFEEGNIDAYTALMHNNRLIAFGRPSQVINSENIEKTFNIESKIINYSIEEKENLKYIIPID